MHHQNQTKVNQQQQQAWKDFVDNEASLDLEEVESNVVTSSAEIQDNAEDDSTLPSIEELTKNVQNLIEQDNIITDDLDKSIGKCISSLSFALILIIEVSEKVKEDVDESRITSSLILDPADEKCRTTLSRLQDEIDKLLAPLTPPTAPSAILTPKDEIPEDNDDDEEEENEEDKLSVASSSVSSSPFELCEIICTETEAIVETIPEAAAEASAEATTKGFLQFLKCLL